MVGQVSQAHRLGRRKYRRDADFLSAAAPASQASQKYQYAGAAERGVQAPHPCGADLPQWRELPQVTAGACGRDPRELARAASLSQHGRSARAQKGGAAAGGMIALLTERCAEPPVIVGHHELDAGETAPLKP